MQAGSTGGAPAALEVDAEASLLGGGGRRGGWDSQRARLNPLLDRLAPKSRGFESLNDDDAGGQQQVPQQQQQQQDAGGRETAAQPGRSRDMQEEEVAAMFKRWCPEEEAGWLSRLFFSFANSLVAKGASKHLEQADLWDTAFRDEPARQWAALEHALNATASPAAPQGVMWRALWLLHRRVLLLTGLVKLLHDVVMFAQPYILEQLLHHLSGPSSRAYTAGLAAAMLVAALLEAATINVYFYHLFRMSLHVKTQLLECLYRKSLRISSAVKASMGAGPIVNLQSNDAAKLWALPTYMHMIWNGPFQIVVVMGMLVRVLTLWPSLAGLGVTVAIIPLTMLLGRLLTDARKASVAAADARVKLVSEVVTGIKAIKLYAWEEPYLSRITALREQELAAIRRTQLLSMVNSSIFNTGPVLVSLAAFGTYAALGHPLTAAVAFPSLALFNLLRFPIVMIPQQIMNLIASSVGFGRIQRFMDAEEQAGVHHLAAAAAPRSATSTPKHNGTSSNSLGASSKHSSTNSLDGLLASSASGGSGSGSANGTSDAAAAAAAGGGGGGGGKTKLRRLPKRRVSWADGRTGSGRLQAAVEIRGSFAWDASAPRVLHNIAFEVPTGLLVMVVGPVGAGKSSLLAAALGELVPAGGVKDGHAVAVAGSVAYTAQDPWIQNATLRDNVLMGLPYDAAKYAQALAASCLDADVQALPAGDASEIGEKGINLSGGQKHRVALARALYADADVYLLDDPLSAVDAHVGRHLFDKCVCGDLCEKTRVLVTHQLQYLPRADLVVVMLQGRIAHAGPYHQLVSQGVDLAAFVPSEEQQQQQNGAANGADAWLDDGPDDARSSGSFVLQELPPGLEQRGGSFASHKPFRAGGQQPGGEQAPPSRPPPARSRALARQQLEDDEDEGSGAAGHVSLLSMQSALSEIAEVSEADLLYCLEGGSTAGGSTAGTPTATPPGGLRRVGTPPTLLGAAAEQQRLQQRLSAELQRRLSTEALQRRASSEQPQRRASSEALQRRLSTEQHQGLQQQGAELQLQQLDEQMRQLQQQRRQLELQQQLMQEQQQQDHHHHHHHHQQQQQQGEVQAFAVESLHLQQQQQRDEQQWDEQQSERRDTEGEADSLLGGVASAPKRRQRRLSGRLSGRLRRLSSSSATSDALAAIEEGFGDGDGGGGGEPGKGRLVSKEARAKGQVKGSVYMAYLSAWGPLLLLPIAVTLAALSERGLQVLQNVVLSAWSNHTNDVRQGLRAGATDTLPAGLDANSSYGLPPGELNLSLPGGGDDDYSLLPPELRPSPPAPPKLAPQQTALYLSLYCALGLSSVAVVLGRSALLVLGSIAASRRLHAGLLAKLLRLPMAFFDSQPTGRLVNRFTKDTEALDAQMAASVSSALTCLASAGLSVVVVVAVSPFTLAVLLPLALLYYRVQVLYIRTSRELKRLDALAFSPIFSHYSESLAGLPTIRAFGRQALFADTNRALIASSNRAWWPIQLLNRWLSMRLELTGAFVVAAAALAVGLVAPRNAGLAGLALTAALNLTGTLSWMVRMTTELEVNMNSVERMVEYGPEPEEAAAVIPGRRPPASWPSEGGLAVVQLVVRYRPELPPVLRGLTFNVAPREKLGVCGRTGCGKSTLMAALFRLVEPCGGAVLVDGLDTATLGLADLRSRLSLVPQDPVIFSGTVRSNLDPFGQAGGDGAIWEALRAAGVDALVRSLGAGLDSPIQEGGANLSGGQRQLLCMARALLRHSRILILDEATSNVDPASDALIQATIRRAFRHTTVLTIAHRLHTVADADRVLVMEAGRVAELAPPAELLGRPGGVFAGMMEEAGRAHGGS